MIDKKLKEEWWDILNSNLLDRPLHMVMHTQEELFYEFLDHAYALGKEKEAITQEEIEKAAKKYDSEHAYYNSNDVIECFVEGANFALGKHEKDAVTIDKEEYDKLCKYRRYAANWAYSITVCPICGEYNPSGCICSNCNNDKNWDK